ncbi:MAG: response regulator [bacterium]|nr:response regulator [bacterium]
MKSILLVEDDPFLIDIYTTKFKESGFQVEVASDGEMAVKKAAERKFDIIILDIVLPQMDGWEVLAKMQAMNDKPSSSPRQGSVNDDLKIIVLSNLGQKEEVEKGLKLGADKYLIKAHYTPSEVVAEIKKVLK